jgi:poly-gamma-glutamate synthesis protein (capsule biosynthesis protein)
LINQRENINQVTLLIGGDLSPTLSNYSVFSDVSINSIVDDKLLAVLRAADFRIFNLEVPLSDIWKPIRKDGPNIIAPVLNIKGIKLLDITIAVLANNHIMDHDEQGLYQTMEQLAQNEIRYVGAGNNLENAAKPLIIEKKGLKVGIYACAENEFSIAGTNRGGANPFDPLETPDHISDLKSKCDFVVVLHHGGKEHYRYPSPDLRKVCRKMAEKGADLVICQHSHCIGAFEKYKGSVIIYGQGNFLFDRNDNEFWNTGLLVKVVLSDKLSLEYIPVQKKGNGVELPDSKVGESILELFHERSVQISEPGFVEAEFEKFCDENGQYFMSVFAGFGKIVRNIDKLFNGLFTKLLYSWEKISRIRNHVECESQREIVLTYLRKRMEKK